MLETITPSDQFEEATLPAHLVSLASEVKFLGAEGLAAAEVLCLLAASWDRRVVLAVFGQLLEAARAAAALAEQETPAG